MGKLIVDRNGNIKATADGITILKAMQIDNPIIKIIMKAAEALDNEIGDGIKSMLIITKGLLENAEKLLDEGLPSDLITSGYKKAFNKATQIMKEISIPIKYQDSTLKNIAMTSLGSKYMSMASDHITNLSINVAKCILNADMKSNAIDIKDMLENIKFIKKSGKSIMETQFIKGIIIEKKVLDSDMPKKVRNAKILLLESPLEINRKEFYAEIQTRPELMKAFVDQENDLRNAWTRKIKSGTNVIVCQKGIDVRMQENLAKYGILGVHYINKQDMEKIAKATAGRVIINIHSLTSKDLGSAGIVEEKTVGGDKMVVIEDCNNPKSVSILIRAGSVKVADEVERALKDALCNVINVYLCNRIVGGGGAFEIELAKNLKKYALKVPSKEQLAISAFADSLEKIPETLAKNAGLNQIDIKLKLRSEHEKDAGLWTGINVLSRRVEDTLSHGIVEPLLIKKQVLRTATEIASMIIKTANIISLPTNQTS